MKKNLLLEIPGALALILLLVIYDTGVARWLANSYLKAELTTLTCLDYELSLKGQLKINHLCAEIPGLQVDAKGLEYAIKDAVLNIDQLDLAILSDDVQTKAPSTPARIEIPEGLPKVTINEATLKVNDVLDPLSFSVEQIAENRFLIQNNWQMQVVLNDQQIFATIDWRMNDFAAWIPVELVESLPHPMMQQAMSTKIHFDGLHVSLSQPLPLAQTINHRDCDVKLESSGELTARYSIQSQRTEFDASSYALQASIISCAPMAALPAQFQAQRFLASIPTTVTWQNGLLEIPSVTLQSSEGFAGRLEARDITFNQSAGLKSYLELSSFSDQSLMVSASAVFRYFDAQPFIDEGTAGLRITKSNIKNWLIDRLVVESDFTYHPNEGARLDGKLNLTNLRYDTISVDTLDAALSLSSADLQQVDVTLQSQLSTLSSKGAKAKEISTNLIGLFDAQQQLSLSGSSNIDELQFDGLSSGTIEIGHQVQHGIKENSHISQHNVLSATGLTAQIDLTEQQVSLSVPNQPLSNLSRIVKQRFNEADILDGHIEVDINYYIPDENGSGAINIQNLDLTYAQYALANLSFAPEFTLNSAGLQLVPANLSIDKLFTGIPINNVQATISSEDNKFVANTLQGELLGGEFNLERLELHPDDQAIELGFNGINLATLLQVQEAAGVQGPGISISGEIAGTVPLRVNNGQVSIDDGELANLAPGWLKISGNAAFESLKSSQPEISRQLSLLENLRFDSLTSNVSMQPDGLLNLTMQIEGNNPDVNEDIVFNYSHEQNLFTLLKSIRLSDEIKERVDAALSDDKSQ